jgi:hypothetical protein
MNLLRLAQKLEIGRFEANLIIVVAQHRAGNREPLASARQSQWWVTPLTIAMTQAAIIFSAWVILG